MVEAGEECDLGMQNSDTGACTSMCKNAKCGDGLVQMGVEQCDQGMQNSNTGACTLACKNAACGDGFVQMGVEECDQGMQNSNTGACTLVCKNAKCGDGFVQMGSAEVCDDGNMTQGDGCNIDCKPSGSVVFTKPFNFAGTNDDIWSAVATDATGNIYLAGATAGAASADAVVRKYDPMGNVVWTQTYNGAANLNDQALGVAVDGMGNVIAVGFESEVGPHKNIWVQKYNSMGGTVWTKNFYLQVTGFDNTANGVTVNAAGDIFIVGSGQINVAQNQDLFVAKLAGINGTIVWADIVNGAVNGNDMAYGVAVDASTVVATGFINTLAANGADAWVRKYTDNGNTNTIVWTKTYNGVANGPDFGAGVAIDTMGNVIVAGGETVAGQMFNVWVQKYNSAGTPVWTQGYNNVANKDDAANAVAVDKSNNSIIVTGAETPANGFGDIWTRKYSSAGTPLWTQTYDGAADTDDSGNGVAVDSNGFIFVCGYETTSNTGLDGWLTKYEP